LKTAEFLEYRFVFVAGGACDVGRLPVGLDTLRTPSGPGTGPLSVSRTPRPDDMRFAFGLAALLLSSLR